MIPFASTVFAAADEGITARCDNPLSAAKGEPITPVGEPLASERGPGEVEDALPYGELI
jgi:hypothetical protein